MSFGGWNSNCTDCKFSQFAQGYSAELSQVIESEFNHYLLRLNIGRQSQRNVRDVVVAGKIKFIQVYNEYENHILLLSKIKLVRVSDGILRLHDHLINDYFSV